MKCVVLAGGRGTRLWPVSRENLPKQFVQIRGNHSMFQETVSRNLPFADEFIILSSIDYRFIVEEQMRAFQGTPYRCVYEEESRGPLNAMMLALMDLAPSEYIFMVVSDHVIYPRPETGSGELDYKDSVMLAKQYASEDALALFSIRETELSSRYGYIRGLKEDGTVTEFIEKPSSEQIAKMDLRSEAVYRNLGMLVCKAGTLLHEFRRLLPEEYALLKETYARRSGYRQDLKYVIEGSMTEYDLNEAGGYSAEQFVYYPAETEENLKPVHLCTDILQKAEKVKAVRGVFLWRQVDTLEDLDPSELSSSGPIVEDDTQDNLIINMNPEQTVVVHGLDHVTAAVTKDAVYIGTKGRSQETADVIGRHEQLQKVRKAGTVFYRPWGHYETLAEGNAYRIRRVFLPAGNRIPAHLHESRTESVTILEGSAEITLNGEKKTFRVNDHAEIVPGTEHSIYNPGNEMLVFAETASGDILSGADLILKEQDQTDEGTAESLIKLKPHFTDALWGGTQIRDRFSLECDYDRIAEAWMMSAHPAGNSIISSGRYKGMRFGEYIRREGKDVLGWKCSPLQNFPLLVKLIDARQNLSVQVHPDDDYALANENDYGKNEMWYIIDAEPGAGIYAGFSRDVTKEEVRQKVGDCTIMDVLNFFPVKPGDVFLIPAGTVHAIGAGCLICEIQQSSNCTYRLYDYDRRDKYGNARELHLEKALDVLNLKRFVPAGVEKTENSSGHVIARCKYFETSVYTTDGTAMIPVEESRFRSIICISGSGTLSLGSEKIDVRMGDSIFVPACEGQITAEGKMTLVVSHI